MIIDTRHCSLIAILESHAQLRRLLDNDLQCGSGFGPAIAAINPSPKGLELASLDVASFFNGSRARELPHERVVAVFANVGKRPTEIVGCIGSLKVALEKVAVEVRHSALMKHF